MSHDTDAHTRCRFRALGLSCGILPTGPLNAITDVAGVLVGHVTLIEGDDIRTGATAILPHAGNLYQEKVPAGVVVGNGYGKLMGSSQIAELGEIETPILLTNTLAVPRAADAILDWTLNQPGNEAVRSVNMVVGETNDGYLNEIRRRALTPAMIGQAITAATTGAVAEGCVGAGAGTVAFGWKGGIGTSSRQLPAALGGYTVGLLVQSNYGGVLQMAGQPVGQQLGQYYLREQLAPQSMHNRQRNMAKSNVAHYRRHAVQQHQYHHSDGKKRMITASGRSNRINNAIEQLHIARHCRCTSGRR